jgi:hypothetical protein
MASLLSMIVCSGIGMENFATQIAAQDHISWVYDVMVLLYQLSAEFLGPLENVIALLTIPCRHVKRVVNLIFCEDLGYPIVMDDRPHNHTAEFVLTLAELEDITGL